VVRSGILNSGSAVVAFSVVSRGHILLSGQVQYTTPTDGIRHPWCNGIIMEIVEEPLQPRLDWPHGGGRCSW